MEERTVQTWWIKVRSHVDIEGNEQADRLAEEGVKRHGVKLVEESRKAGQQSQKRDREEEEPAEMKKINSPAGR